MSILRGRKSVPGRNSRERENGKRLAIKSGNLYFPSITKKLFAKLPPSLSKKIEELFKAKHPSLSAGVLPAIKFTHTFVSKMCKDVVLAKELRDLSLCSAIPILGYYKNNRKKYGIRKSRTYKGKPHNSHVNPFKRKSKQGNIARSAVYQELNLDDNWDIISADFDDSSVYSISEGEGDVHQNISVMVQDTLFEEAAFMTIEDLSDDERSIKENYDDQNSHHAFMFYPGQPIKIADMVQSAGSWKPDKELPTQSKSCEHDWKENAITNYTITTTIIDTESSACCINKKVIPEEALEPSTQIIFFNGLNSRQHATHIIKQGSFLIEGNKFKIPLLYAFDMRDNNGIEMLIGANFLRSMKGEIQIKGDAITIYKKVPKIKTSNQTKVAKIAELEVSEQEFLKINESIYFNQEGSLVFLEQFKPVIERSTIKTCDSSNGRFIQNHVDSLLEIGAIRPSKSRYRTMAMIVNLGITIDPTSEREINGKERMVFNYKSLNDNTYKDQYPLPGIKMIIKRVGGAKIFSKFDLKSQFHQVAMDEESIPWTAFLVPGGLYEWLVMPFSLKDAPVEHAKHLEKMLKICEDNVLDLSPTKMKIVVLTIDFLGTVIGERTIKLQPHIIKKIVNFNDKELKTKKGLRSFLGILNYSRNHIPKLGILLRPLYEKTNAHGDKRLKPSDYELMDAWKDEEE
nr:ORFIII-like polyprotein [Tanacetum cinerariifolium]